MSEPVTSQTSVPPSIEAGGRSGFLQNLGGLYFSPRETFTRIVREGRWLWPAVAYLLLSLAFVGIWTSRMEPREFMKAQLEESGRWDKIPADRRDVILDQQAKMIPIFSWVGAVVGTVLMFVVVGGALLLIYRFLYASEVSFKQALAVVAWSFLAVGLVMTPLVLAVMGLKGDWNMNPQEALQANLSLLLDRSTAARPLWTLLASLDLVTIWQIFLLASGFAVASRKTTGSAVWGVLVPWAIIVMVKVGWSALF